MKELNHHYKHHYDISLRWTGNLGTGTSDYRSYGRQHEIAADGKPTLLCSSDPAFRGDASRWNPEELLIASLAACHKLWYLHLCAVSGVVVTEYEDRATGTLAEDREAGGFFVDAVLRPKVTIAAGSDPDKARSLHPAAHARCFIANSVNFPVRCEPEIFVAATLGT